MVAAYNLEAADDLSVPPKHPDSDLVEVNKIGWDHLAGGGKWWQFTECLHLQALKLPFGAKDETL